MMRLTLRLSAALIASVIVFTAFSLRADINNKQPVVILETALGEIHIEVYLDKAPLSAGSFLTAIDSGLFGESNGTFYRAVHEENDIGSPKIDVIQGGIRDYTKSLPLIPHETTQQTGLLHQDGTVSLTRANGSSGSGNTFFICIGNQPALDYGGKRYADGQGFAAFGHVIQGMDIVRRIQRMDMQIPTTDRPTAAQRLVKPVTILKAYRQ